MMKPSKIADSKVDLSMWTQWTPTLIKEVIIVGPTHSSIIITQTDEEKIEMEE